MWLSEQKQRPARTGEGQTGVVTMAGDCLAVRLDHEVRRPELYGPAGYRWEPKAGDRVLVIKGEQERPCIVGVKQGSAPACVSVEADTVQLRGEVTVNGVPLEEYIARIAVHVMGGSV